MKIDEGKAKIHQRWTDNGIINLRLSVQTPYSTEKKKQKKNLLTNWNTFRCSTFETKIKKSERKKPLSTFVVVSEAWSLSEIRPKSRRDEEKEEKRWERIIYR